MYIHQCVCVHKCVCPFPWNDHCALTFSSSPHAVTSRLVKQSHLWLSDVFFQVKWSRNAIRLVINRALAEMLFSLHPHPPTQHTHTGVHAHSHTHKHGVSAPWCAEKIGCRRLDNDTSYTETCKWTARTQTPTNTRLNRKHTCTHSLWYYMHTLNVPFDIL